MGYLHREPPPFELPTVLTPSRDDATAGEAGVAHHIIIDGSICTVQLGHQEIQEENLSSSQMHKMVLGCAGLYLPT